jgi:hypothetical protein
VSNGIHSDSSHILPYSSSHSLTDIHAEPTKFIRVQ